MNEYKFKCREYLSAQGIDVLRPYARLVGVAQPTTKKKRDLIEGIISVLVGELAPEYSNRGAPLKNNYVPPEMLDKIQRLQNEYAYSSDVVATSEFTEQYREFIKNNKSVLYFESNNASEIEEREKSARKTLEIGQLEFFGEVACLLPLDCTDNSKQIIVPNNLIEEYGLREGDVLSCYTRKGEKMYVVDKILAVNEVVAENGARGKFEEKIVRYPHERIAFYDERFSNSVTAKYLSWLLPAYKGQRGLILSVPKAGKTSLLFDMAVATTKADKNLVVFVLLNAQSPESVGQFRKACFSDKLVYTTYDDEPERQVFVANFILKRAKRYAESGGNVLLFVDSFNALAHSFNETQESSGGKVLAYGLESKTLQYIRKYFGSARCFEEGGSLTVIGAVAEGTGNPADDFISAELGALANLNIRLSERLALQRIFPAVDLQRSNTQRGTQEDASDKVRTSVCRDVIPRQGEEAVRTTLAQSQNVEEFIAKTGIKL